MPVIAAAAIVGGSSLISGVLGASAAGSAANAQVQAAQLAENTQLQMYNQNRADLAPYRQAGYAGLNTLEGYLGISQAPVAPNKADFYTTTQTGALGLGRGPSVGPGPMPTTALSASTQENVNPAGRSFPSGSVGSFNQAGYDAAMKKYQSDLAAYNAKISSPTYGSLLKPFTAADLQNYPGYQFQLSEGQRGIQNLASAGQLPGGYLSGATLKELLSYGQGLADQTYGEAFNQHQAQNTNIYNMLAGITGTGQASTQQTAQLGAQAANNISGLQTAAGASRASGYVGQSNALTSGLMGGAQSAAGGLLLNSILNPSSSSVGGNLAYSPQMVNLYSNPSMNVADYANVGP